MPQGSVQAWAKLLDESKRVYTAVVCGAERISPATKLLTLRVLGAEPRFRFSAGQWVDLHTSVVDAFSSFSICSLPDEAISTSIIKIAVQYSGVLPTAWMWTRCDIGDRFSFCLGGSVHFPMPGVPHGTDLLLIAGGIGISSLYSIFQETTKSPMRVTLLYSVKHDCDLLFKTNIRMITSNLPEKNHRFYITRPETGHIDADTVARRTAIFIPFSVGRIDQTQIYQALSGLNMALLHCYICCPYPMMAAIKWMLVVSGVYEGRIYYEIW